MDCMIYEEYITNMATKQLSAKPKFLLQIIKNQVCEGLGTVPDYQDSSGSRL